MLKYMRYYFWVILSLVAHFTVSCKNDLLIQIFAVRLTMLLSCDLPKNVYAGLVDIKCRWLLDVLAQRDKASSFKV